MPKRRDDSEMSRFEREGLLRFRARDSVLAIALVAVILLIFSGGSILEASQQQRPGVTRDILVAVGKPAGWASGNLPFEAAGSSVTASLSPDEKLDETAGFENGSAAQPVGVPPVTPDAFDPVELGEKPPPKRPLHTLLVTGDSLSQPLDVELARRLTPDGVEVDRDAHVGTGISNDALIDWGQLSKSQVEKFSPDAVVVFIGANEGYLLPGPDGKDVNCCGADWAAVLSNRARQMISTYRQDGKADVYWLTVPTPRDPARQRISNVVNTAINVAAQPWRSDVRIVDMVPIFAPDGVYEDALTVGGEQTIVRESDGIHLNEAGSAIAADEVLRRIDLDFTH